MMQDNYMKEDKSIPKNILFDYRARGFYCPSCDAGLSLHLKECPWCKQALKNPYEDLHIKEAHK